MSRSLSCCAVLLACVASTAHLTAQSTDQASFDRSVRPVLAKYCITCHNEKLNTANLNLDAVNDPAVWDKVLDKLSAGKMPPTGLPAPSKAEISAVTSWIESTTKRTNREPDPGRVTARRLNRVEYNNTVHDLLHVALRPADEFPVDDSGYGFDNIGDVLSVSPLLMGKYMSAAKKLSKVAIYGDTIPPKPIVLGHLMGKKGHDGASGGIVSSNAYLPFSLRGAMYGSFVFPVDGEYEFRVRIANYRGQDPADLPQGQGRPQAAQEGQTPDVPQGRGGRGGRAGRGGPQTDAGATEGQAPARRGRGRGEVTAEQLQAAAEAARKAFPPVKLVLTVDGKSVLTGVVEGNVNFEYSRGDFVTRIPVKAGEHTFRASYPELADMPDPLRNRNPDLRRKLYVDYIDIVGPFSASADPPESYKSIFICGHRPGQHTQECARKVVSNLLRRAYRRPITEEEIASKLQLIAMARKEKDTFEEGVRVALQAILVSPSFLFRIERDAKPKGAGVAAHLVSEHELASRLSYFLWATMPDDELTRVADQQQLRKPGVLEAQVRRMMADPKSENLVENFGGQWLQLRNLGRTKPDPERFAVVDDELLDAMRQETLLFIAAIMREDRSILDFIDAKFTYLNGPLARHYGIPGISGEQFQRVTLDGEQRSGLLTQASVLTVSSYPTRTSPPVRGKWVLENLLGMPPPPPPANVPALDDSTVASTASMRERMEQHRKDPNCSVCHTVMDPIGFGLESYDAVGRWRTHDGKALIDTAGSLPDGKSFGGAKDLKQILKGQSEAFTRNVSEKMLTYALGRGVESHDKPAVDRISRQVAANDYRFSTLVLEIVNSTPFQMRSGDGGKQ